MGRASSALTNELNTLDQTTSEYGSWDLTYEYVHGENPSYVKTEFPATTFQQLKISFVVIWMARATNYSPRASISTHGGEIPIPGGLEDHLKPGSLLLTHDDSDSKVAGILDLPADLFWWIPGRL